MYTCAVSSRPLPVENGKFHPSLYTCMQNSLAQQNVEMCGQTMPPLQQCDLAFELRESRARHAPNGGYFADINSIYANKKECPVSKLRHEPQHLMQIRPLAHVVWTSPQNTQHYLRSNVHTISNFFSNMPRDTHNISPRPSKHETRGHVPLLTIFRVGASSYNYVVGIILLLTCLRAYRLCMVWCTGTVYYLAACVRGFTRRAPHPEPKKRSTEPQSGALYLSTDNHRGHLYILCE